MFTKKIQIEFKQQKCELYKYVDTEQFKQFLIFLENEMVSAINQWDYQAFETIKKLLEKLFLLQKKSWNH